MASIQSLILASLLLTTTLSFFFHVSNANYVLPIVKDNQKSQYFTSILVGKSQVRVNMIIDLGLRWSWFTCAPRGSQNSSSSFTPLGCSSAACSTYDQQGCVGDYCGVIAINPWFGTDFGDAVLGEDTISLYSQTKKNPLKLAKTSLPNYPLACADKRSLEHLSPHAKGVVSLANNYVSLPYQISTTLKVPKKFAFCLPAYSSPSFATTGYNGAMYFGGGPYHLPSTSATDLSKSLITTPVLVRNEHFDKGTDEYFINVTSIKVNATPLHFNCSLLNIVDKEYENWYGGSKISTVHAYTTLHSEIYKALVNVFVTKAKDMGMKRVASVAPFGACFDAKTVQDAKTGPYVPLIDFTLAGRSPLLHNKNARWRFYGANSIVKVSENVLCLAFVDGGSSQTMNSIVIGGKQMEDTLVEVDQEANKLGISFSLLRMGTSCSHFKGI